MIDNKITIKDDEKVNIQRGAIGFFTQFFNSFPCFYAKKSLDFRGIFLYIIHIPSGFLVKKVMKHLVCAP